jgi:hypothetical protein
VAGAWLNPRTVDVSASRHFSNFPATVLMLTGSKKTGRNHTYDPVIVASWPSATAEATDSKKSNKKRWIVDLPDNRKAQFCFSSVISEVASDFITNYYYPAQHRNSNAEVLQSAAIGIGVDSAVNVLQEFVLRKFTHEKH